MRKETWRSGVLFIPRGILIFNHFHALLFQFKTLHDKIKISMPHLKECTNEGDFVPPTSVFIIYTATQPQYD